MEAEYFKQYAKRKNWIDHKIHPGSNSYSTRFIRDIEERYLAWLCETLATGLESENPFVVYKSVIFAKDYLKELEYLFAKIEPEFYEGFKVLKKRIENILPESF